LYFRKVHLHPYWQKRHAYWQLITVIKFIWQGIGSYRFLYMKAIFITLLQVTTLVSLAQNKKAVDSVSITFLFPYTKVVDSSQLTLQVVYKNNTDRSVDVYKDLEEGDRGDWFFNSTIEAQKLIQKKYRPRVLRTYISPFLFSIEDSLRHYDVPKKKLLPYASDTLKLDLLKVASSFMPGKYRFRAYLRVKTIRDDRVYNDKNGETEPPEDTIVYTVSQWFYFIVPKYISRIH